MSWPDLLERGRKVLRDRIDGSQERERKASWDGLCLAAAGLIPGLRPDLQGFPPDGFRPSTVVFDVEYDTPLKPCVPIVRRFQRTGANWEPSFFPREGLTFYYAVPRFQVWRGPSSAANREIERQPLNFWWMTDSPEEAAALAEQSSIDLLNLQRQLADLNRLRDVAG